MYTKTRYFSLFTITMILLTVGVAGVGASVLFNISNPESAKLPAIVPPLLAPPGQTDYLQQDAARIIAPDNRPIAQFAKPPADLSQSIAVNLPDVQPAQSGVVSYAILASIQYRGNGHTTLVTTARPSPAAAKQAMALGNQTIQLADGSTAWATTGMFGDAPNQVVFVRSDLIITIAGDLPIDTLKDLARLVTIP